jgi:hypothetical protein
MSNVISLPNNAARAARAMNSATQLATAFNTYWELTLRCHEGYVPTIIAGASDEPEIKHAKAALVRALRNDGFPVYTGANS